MKSNSNSMSGYWPAFLIVIVLTTLTARGQQVASPSIQDQKQPVASSQPAKKTEDKKPGPAKPTFTLSVKSEPILNLSLKAEKAKLAEISEALSRKLKIPVFVGDPIQKELVSTEFSELTLEPAMQLLAPAVYIDYEIRGSGEPARPLAVFFYAADQPEPSPTAVVTGSSQSLLIEGDTEEGAEPETEEERKKEEEQPLKVSFADNLLSVKAKKQPLALVLLKIGEEMGIPVDIQGDAQETIDMALNKMPIEDVVRQLSPNIHLFLRAYLSRAERRALRLVLPSVSKSAQPGF